MFAAFENGYPIVYPDSGTYIHSGFSNVVPDDRPIFYGIFVRHTSLKASIWLPVFAQSCILAWSVASFLGIFFQSRKKWKLLIPVVTILTLSTGFSYHNSHIMPDIFTGILLLNIITFLFLKQRSKTQNILNIVLIILCLLFHMSNVIITFCFGIILLLSTTIHLINIKRKKILLLISSCLFSILMTSFTNYAVGGQFSLSQNGHIFMINHLIENGVLEKYLKKECSNKEYSLCQYRENLSWNFIWDENSILRELEKSDATKKEFNEIIQNIYLSPKYWPILTTKSIIYGARQFFDFRTEIHGSQLANSPPYQQIHWRFRHSLREYISSEQNLDKIDLKTHNTIERIVILLSLGMVLIYIIVFWKTQPAFSQIILISITMLSLNALICANLSTPLARYQSRLIWIIPLLGMVAIIKHNFGIAYFKKFWR
ncbi:MAG: hypothetical protein MRY83_23935 [Flavobacteriales bacterium]|nr:hypothetical protein [Flavobacteriales bacterium]